MIKTWSKLSYFYQIILDTKNKGLPPVWHQLIVAWIQKQLPHLVLFCGEHSGKWRWTNGRLRPSTLEIKPSQNLILIMADNWWFSTSQMHLQAMRGTLQPTTAVPLWWFHIGFVPSNSIFKWVLRAQSHGEKETESPSWVTQKSYLNLQFCLSTGYELLWY